MDRPHSAQFTNISPDAHNRNQTLREARSAISRPVSCSIGEGDAEAISLRRRARLHAELDGSPQVLAIRGQGLMIGIFLYYFCIQVIANEWFDMDSSTEWNVMAWTGALSAT